MQYLTKNSQNTHKKKISSECIDQLPLVASLCLNKWLQVPQIENLLVSLSNVRIEAISADKRNEVDNYHIWIYSLLALHQNYASYTNF
jgi:hypothetical protein